LIFSWREALIYWAGSSFGMLLVLLAYVRRQKWNLFEVGDVLAGPLLLAQSLIYGGWALGGGGQDRGIVLLQSALYLGIALTFTYLWWKKALPAGLLFFSLLVLEGVLQVIIGFFDVSSVRLLGLNVNQWWALVLLAYGVVGWYRLVMKANKKPLPSTFLDKIKARLAQEEKELKEQKEQLEKNDPYLDEQRTDNNAEPADDVVEDLGHEGSSRSLKIVKQTLLNIKVALSRLRRGKYGVCIRCGEPIDKPRLKVLPTADLCSKCAEKEQRSRPTTDPRNLRDIRRVS